MNSQTLFFALLLLTPLAGRAQYASGSSPALTVYANLIQEDREREFFNLTNGQIPDEQESVENLRFGHFSPALSIFHANKHLSEIELSFLRFETDESVYVTELSGPFPGNTRTFSLGLRYAFNFKLVDGQKSLVQPYLGLSVLPYVHKIKTSPEISALYATTQMDMGVLGQLIPRLIIRLSDYIYLDLNAPIGILEAGQQTVQFRNGGQYLPDIKESRTGIRWFPKRMQLRVGLGVEL